MHARIVLFAVGFLTFSVGSSFAQVGSLTTSSVTGEPALPKNVSHVDASAEKGLAWRWTAEGRRDVGQYFLVEQPFVAKTLAIQVRSAIAKAPGKSAFRLRFFQSDAPNDGVLGKQIAELTGELPSSGQKLKSGQWFVIDFDPIKFEAGRYAFVLEFLSGPVEGQGVVFTLGPSVSGPESGFWRSESDAEKYKPCAPFNFILSTGADGSVSVLPTKSNNLLLVDQRGGAPYTSIAAAVTAAQAGDTIKLVEGSGPYREIVDIRQSGQPGSSITFDGSGETITGFEPLTGFQSKGSTWTCDLKLVFSQLKGIQGFINENGVWKNNGFPRALPTVLVYRGERLLQDPRSGQFLKYALLSEDGFVITLKEGVSAEGWEIAMRPFAVRLHNVSHQVYKNVRACGSLNDGFNLHGSGEDLVFENIEGFQNLDEGFSAHDEIHCSITKGRFWGNDNGLYGSQAELTASNIDIYDNLGFGFGISAGIAKLSDVRIWGNGMSQVVLQGGASLLSSNVTVYALRQPDRPWISTQESRKQARPILTQINPSAVLEGSLDIQETVEPSAL